MISSRRFLRIPEFIYVLSGINKIYFTILCSPQGTCIRLTFEYSSRVIHLEKKYTNAFREKRYKLLRCYQKTSERYLQKYNVQIRCFYFIVPNRLTERKSRLLHLLSPINKWSVFLFIHKVLVQSITSAEHLYIFSVKPRLILVKFFRFFFSSVIFHEDSTNKNFWMRLEVLRFRWTYL